MCSNSILVQFYFRFFNYEMYLYSFIFISIILLIRRHNSLKSTAILNVRRKRINYCNNWNISVSRFFFFFWNKVSRPRTGRDGIQTFRRSFYSYHIAYCGCWRTQFFQVSFVRTERGAGTRQTIRLIATPPLGRVTETLYARYVRPVTTVKFSSPIVCTRSLWLMTNVS